MRKIAISLFAGAGGMDIGFEQAGYEVRVAVEQEKRCCETLIHNNPRKAVIEKKIEDVTAEEILKAGRLKKGRADIVIGGPPCQGFSQLGPKNPYDPRNFLFKEFFRIVDGVAPAKFLMENTAALLYSRNRQVFQQILLQAQEAGYAVGFKTLNAADLGVPQIRKRCFVFGKRLPDCERYYSEPRTVRDAIADLEKEEALFNED